jgi:hypothetical protein
VTTRALASCQCSLYGSSCERTATQEDLRCDTCRNGCAAIGWAPAGTPPDQIRITGHWQPPTTTWSSGWGEVAACPTS